MAAKWSARIGEITSRLCGCGYRAARRSQRPVIRSSRGVAVYPSQTQRPLNRPAIGTGEITDALQRSCADSRRHMATTTRPVLDKGHPCLPTEQGHTVRTSTDSNVHKPRMSAPDATLTNGPYELPASLRGVLVLADPPEAGWRMQTRSNQEATADAELLAAPIHVCDSEQASPAEARWVNHGPPRRFKPAIGTGEITDALQRSCADSRRLTCIPSQK
jgi:hypothetical protein